MRKNLGKQTWLYPMPVLIVGSYDKDGNADAMNAAWGGIYDENQVMLCLGEHKTTQNIIAQDAFTVSFADVAHVAEADYVGIVSANNVPDKLDRAGFHTIKSEFVNAPIIEEFPLTLECKLLKINEDGIVIGEIVNVSAEEHILDANGKINVDQLQIITYDPANMEYRRLGEKVGNAFSDGKKIK